MDAGFRLQRAGQSHELTERKPRYSPNRQSTFRPAAQQPQAQQPRQVAHHFGDDASRLVHETSGQSNYVFTAEHDRGTFVLRLSPEGDRLRAYQKEQWAVERVREAGVPTPEILEVGVIDIPWPYMLMRKVGGQEATTHARRLEILTALGENAARINAIPTAGFGIIRDRR